MSLIKKIKNSPLGRVNGFAWAGIFLVLDIICINILLHSCDSSDMRVDESRFKKDTTRVDDEQYRIEKQIDAIMKEEAAKQEIKPLEEKKEDKVKFEEDKKDMLEEIGTEGVDGATESPEAGEKKTESASKPASKENTTPSKESAPAKETTAKPVKEAAPANNSSEGGIDPLAM